jgi:transcription termination factor Rho
MAAQALEQSALEGKDKDQLLQIAKALGVKGISKLKKADLVGAIIDATGGDAAPSASANGAYETVAASTPEAADHTEATSSGDDGARADKTGQDDTPSDPSADASGDAGPALGADGEPLADWELELAEQGVSTGTSDASEAPREPKRDEGERSRAGRDENGRRSNRDGQRGNDRQRDGQGGDDSKADGSRNDGEGRGRNRNDGGNRNQGSYQSGGNRNDGGNRNQGGNQGGGNTDQDGGGNNKRRRRRRKGGSRGQEGPQGEDLEILDGDGQLQSNEPVEVSGYLDIRDEGYGFLRINGYLPSKDDAYIGVRIARQYGLRKGDKITGKMRPAQRNEKNPALLEVHTVNGGDPEAAKKRPRFEDLTALFPDEKLKLEDPSDPTNMTARIIDLISPIGKGQRGILVSPPKAGKTTIMKTIAKMIEKNNPEVELIVLLIDERPEEVTDIRRTVKGEVISSTFDRPSDEHTAIAEMTIAKARRMVESGKDVVIMLDGITRLSRAYNLAAPSSGKILSGGIDAGALYPPKKFFGAARNVEEGGSLTILATALVDTNSRMDEAIFEEFKGTGNMELRLDRKVAERRIYPAIDVDASSTRHEELLFDRKELQMVWKLRRVLSGLAADGNAAPGLELLMDRLKTFKSNSEFLNEIAKQPGM